MAMERKEKKQFNIKALWRQLSDFFDKNYGLFFAPIFVGVLYVSALFVKGVYPFGDKFTAASYDLSAQICPFIEHLFDVLQGKSTLTYSYAIMGGADVTGTFLYFFLSPFSFLFLIFGDGKVAHASSIVMLCKLITIAFTGAWFAKKMFRGIPEYLCMAVGVVYAYCGYMFVSNTYINWVDFLIYLPFCAWAFRRFVQTENFWAFSILCACCIYTCFSIACFSLFTVFPALIAYGLICLPKADKKKFLTKLCVSFVAAILLALPVLLPALGAYLNSARGGSLFENLWYGFKNVSDTGVPEDFNSSDFLDTYSTSLYRKWSYILSDAIFVVLTLIWFVRKGLKNPFAKFMLVAGVMTLLPLVVDESMQLMNMGSYMSYALRFGFLNALYFLGGACLCLEDICFEKGKTFDGKPLFSPIEIAVNNETIDEKTKNEPTVCENNEKKAENTAEKPKAKKNKFVYVCTGILVALGAVCALFVGWFTMDLGYEEFWKVLTDDSSLIDSLDGFAGSFAHSLGGFEVVIIPFVVVLVLGAVGALFVSLRKTSPRILSYLLIVVVGVQVVFYNNTLVAGNASTQHVKGTDYQILSAELNARNEGEYFRVKDNNDKFTADIPFAGDSNSFSVFSSVIDEDNFTTFQLFGYKGNGKNTFKSAHNTSKKNRSDEFGDSFLGYKYFFVHASGKDETEIREKLEKVETSKTYLKAVKTVDENGNEVHLHSGEYYVYENEIVFPLGYRVSGEAFRFVRENTNNNTNRKYNQAALYQYLRGENLKEFTGSEYVTPKSARELSEYLWEKAAQVKVSAGQITARVEGAKAGEALLLNFVASKGYQVTVNGKTAQLTENDLDFLMVQLEEGDNEIVFTYSSPYVKYAGFGVLAGIVGLCAVWFVVQKTKFVDVCAGVIATAGVVLALAVVAFFMVYPSCVYVVKLIEWI